MLSIYIASLAFGGVMLLASMLGGDGHAGGGGGEAGVGDAGHGDPGHAAGGSAATSHAASSHAQSHDRAGAQSGHAGFLPFLSLRFWTFGLTFFGLAGLLLAGPGLLVGTAAALVSAGFGIGAGWTAARVFQSLARDTVGRLGDGESHVGREGRLLLPVTRAARGKLRVSVGDTQIDMLAETESDEPLPAGSPVLIVGLRGSVALVERTPSGPAALEAVPAHPGETKKEPSHG